MGGIGTGRRIPTRLPRQRRSLRRVLPRHHNQPIGNLVVGGKECEAQTDIGLAAKIGRARHDEDPPGFFCNAVGSVRFLTNG